MFLAFLFPNKLNFKKKKRIFWQPDFFKYLHFKYQQFLWKYQILPALIWTALVSLRSKRAPGQNGAFCNCFSSCKPAQTLNFKFEMFIFHSKYFVYRKLKMRCKKWVFVLSDRILILAEYWVTYRNVIFLSIFFVQTMRRRSSGSFLTIFAFKLA